MYGTWVRIPRIIRTNPTININLYVEIRIVDVDFLVDIDFTFLVNR